VVTSILMIRGALIKFYKKYVIKNSSVCVMSSQPHPTNGKVTHPQVILTPTTHMKWSVQRKRANILQKSTRHLKILSAWKMKFHT